MKEASLHIRYQVFQGLSELSAEDRELAEAAIQAQQGSYAPYSKFHVGAAVRMANGVIVKGSNQENAASPSGLCAERTALFAAGAAWPDIPVEAMAITGGYDHSCAASPCTPCGACRQVMAEYEQRDGHEMTLLCYLAGGRIRRIKGVKSLLPFTFEAQL